MKNGHSIIRALLLWTLAAVTTPAVAVDVNGQLKRAQLEKLSSDPTCTEARTYYNTVDKNARYCDGTSWYSLSTLAGTETLTNKTITQPIIDGPLLSSHADLVEIATPAAPSPGNLRLYSKDDNNLYVQTSDGDEKKVGSGAGSGIANLYENGDAEDPATPSGWGTYADSGAAPTDGTGGSPTISGVSRITSSQIDGAASWKFSKPASNVQGQGWSYAFTIPANSSFKNSLVAWNFSYYLSTASVSDVFRIYLYDVTNGVMITPSFTTCGGGTTPTLALSTTTCAGKFAAVLTTGTSYRALIHIASTSTTAADLVADGFEFSNYRAQPGAAVGGWQSYTPIWTGGSPAIGNGTVAGQWRRVGDTMEAVISITSGSTTTYGSGVWQWSLPSGYTINASALANSSNTEVLGISRSESATTYYTGTAMYATSTTVKAATSSGTVAWGSTAPFTPSSSTAGQKWELKFTVPIAEWAGGTSFGENKFQYACSTTGTWDAAATSANTVFGPNGCPISGSLTADRNKVIQWQTPNNALASPWLEYRVAGTTNVWVKQENSAYPSMLLPALNFGGRISTGTSTTSTVAFAQYAQMGTSYNSSTGAGNWSNAVYDAWRLTRPSPGMAVPFGLATSTTPGLVSLPTGYTQTVVPDYETGSFSATFNSGAFTSTAVTVAWVRIGKIVTMTIPKTAVTANATNNFAATSTGVVPSSIRPPSDHVRGVIYTLSSGSTDATRGGFFVLTNGQIEIDRSGNWTSGTANCGWDQSQLTYSL